MDDFSTNPIINIVSRREQRNWRGGPGSVVGHTIREFDRIGQRYVINRQVRGYQWNWIHDDSRGLLEIALAGIPAVLGPNIAQIPAHLPCVRPKLNGCVYLLPSQWVVDMWRVARFTECPIEVWPVGIPLSTEPPSTDTRQPQVLVYHKQRGQHLVDLVLRALRSKNLSYQIIEYGSYNRDDYLLAARTCQFGVWIGRSETQGVALLEALGEGLPLIVIDVSCVNDNAGIGTYRMPSRLGTLPATSAPYFDSTCGIILKDPACFTEALKQMISGYSQYRPRNYVARELSPEKTCRRLIDLFTTYCGKRQHDTVPNSAERRFKLSQLGTILDIVSRIILRGRVFRETVAR